MKSKKNQLFESVYKQNKDKLYRLCMGFTGNTTEADDLFQEIQLKIWNNLDSFRNESSINTWTYRVATNTALLYVNRRNRSQNKMASVKPEQLQLEQESVKTPEKYQISQLHRAIVQLKEIDRIIITLLLEKYSYQEIASITGLPANHVGVKINRIKKQLKKKLENNG